jgi:hypothetical protein
MSWRNRERRQAKRNHLSPTLLVHKFNKAIDRIDKRSHGDRHMDGWYLWRGTKMFSRKPAPIHNGRKP